MVFDVELIHCTDESSQWTVAGIGQMMSSFVQCPYSVRDSVLHEKGNFSEDTFIFTEE